MIDSAAEARVQLFVSAHQRAAPTSCFRGVDDKALAAYPRELTVQPFADAGDSVTSQLRAMTFNIRYAAPSDLENSWERRRDLVGRTVQRFGPDLLATQEGLDFQLGDLHRFLGDSYALVGAGRDDGRRQGEFVAIFFRCGRFSLIDQGHFWLSETPDVPGSKGWDSRQPRMATWCVLQDALCPAERLHVLNTHFDFRGETAREESAKLLRDRVVSLGLERPILVMGDFNCGEDDVPYRTLLHGDARQDNATASADTLVNAYRCRRPRKGPAEFTRHDFGRQTMGARIDWILHSRRLETLRAEIDRTDYEGRFPSDHYPVTAILRPAPLANHGRI